MVKGALLHSSLATVGVSVSGIAGPDGGSEANLLNCLGGTYEKKGRTNSSLFPFYR